jgi:hypothetical protein
LRVHAVRPLNGAAETSVSAMPTSFANRVGSTEGAKAAWLECACLQAA